MIRRLVGVAMLLVACTNAIANAAQNEPVASVQETALDVQTRQVASQLRCVVCLGLSIQDSPSSLAQEMRGIVREQLAAGRTPEQVKQYFVDKYGQFVLLEPEPRGFNLLVYILPVAMLLGGAAFVYVKARQWTRKPQPDEAHV